MKLKQGFITHEVMGKQVMLAAGEAAHSFHGIVRNNRTAAFIVDCLKEETTEAAIVEAMEKSFDAPRKVMEQDVHRIIETLQSIGALEE